MNALQRPPALKPGDTIAIVPTARAITIEELRDGIALAGSWGLRVKLGDSIGRKHFQQAGTAKERAADLQAAIDDPQVKAIWCARGGYGTVHLMEHLRLSALKRSPKWLVGFSDITVLHNALHNMGLCSLHAQMPFMIAAKSEGCRETLRKALFGEGFEIASGGVGGASATEVVAHRTGSCEGVQMCIRDRCCTPRWSSRPSRSSCWHWCLCPVVRSRRISGAPCPWSLVQLSLWLGLLGPIMIGPYGGGPMIIGPYDISSSCRSRW